MILSAQFASFLPGLYKGLGNDPDHPKFTSVYQFPIVVANAIEILLVLIGALAVVFIMYGGILYITSSGEPAKTAAAKTAITNAVLGLVLSSSAFLILDFITRRF